MARLDPQSPGIGIAETTGFQSKKAFLPDEPFANTKKALLADSTSAYARFHAIFSGKVVGKVTVVGAGGVGKNSTMEAVLKATQSRIFTWDFMEWWRLRLGCDSDKDLCKRVTNKEQLDTLKSIESELVEWLKSEACGIDVMILDEVDICFGGDAPSIGGLDEDGNAALGVILKIANQVAAPITVLILHNVPATDAATQDVIAKCGFPASGDDRYVAFDAPYSKEVCAAAIDALLPECKIAQESLLEYFGGTLPAYYSFFSEKLGAVADVRRKTTVDEKLQALKGIALKRCTSAARGLGDCAVNTQATVLKAHGVEIEPEPPDVTGALLTGLMLPDGTAAPVMKEALLHVCEHPQDNMKWAAEKLLSLKRKLNDASLSLPCKR